MSTQPGTEAATEQVHEQVGLRNQLRARWRALPTLTRAGISIAVELVRRRALLLHARPCARLRRRDDRRHLLAAAVPFYPRVAGEAALVAIFLIFGPRSLAVLLAVAFSVSLAPPKYRDWVIPAVDARGGDPLSVLPAEALHDPGLRCLARRRDGRLHARVHHDGRRPEHRRRLRRAARSRLRRVLRDGRLHRSLVHVASVLAPDDPLRRGRHRPEPGGDPHLDLAPAAACRRGHRGDRDHHRPADLAAARRLPRDRDPRLRGDPPADRPQRRQPLRLQPDQRAERDHAARPDRLRPSRLQRDGRLPACQLPHVLLRGRSSATRSSRRMSSSGPRSCCC